MSDIRVFFSTILSIIVILLMIGLFVFNFNPYKNFDGNIKFGLNKRKYAPLLGKNLKFNTLILGSSMSLNTLCSDVDKEYNVESMNFSFSGTSSSEIAFLWHYMSKYRKIKMVICDIYFHREIKFLKSLIDPSIYNDNSNFFSHDNFAFNIAEIIIKGIIKKQKISRDDFSAYYKYQSYSKNSMAKNYKKYSLPKTINFDESILIFEQNFKIYLEPCLNMDKQTEIKLFFPPFSIVAYNPETRLMRTF